MKNKTKQEILFLTKKLKEIHKSTEMPYCVFVDFRFENLRIVFPDFNVSVWKTKKRFSSVYHIYDRTLCKHQQSYNLNQLMWKYKKLYANRNSNFIKQIT